MNRIISTPASKFRHFRRQLGNKPGTEKATSVDEHPTHILWRYQILAPDSDIVGLWNHLFLFTSLVALFIDPLYFFLPYIGGPACLSTDVDLGITITYFRSVFDLFFFLHMLMKFRTAFVAPSSRVFGRDCNSLQHPDRKFWLNVTRLTTKCDVSNDNAAFKFGMFEDAYVNDVASSRFLEKYLYCLWWGLRNLSSYGTNLDTSRFIGETIFCILLCMIGLILFSHLIGNMQTYLQSMTVRLEEWRVKRRDTEEWMRHRQLPPDLQERVRRFVQYQWLATRGVNEEFILRSLPLDLRREIQRHLCLALVRRVPFFSQMDDQLLDAICERLVSSLSIQGTYILQEDDPVNEMLFIIRGQLESSTTNGGRSGFFNSITLRPGDFCGEELLTWALMPSSSMHLPSSTRTVRALTEVEAFALRAEDLKFVSGQFKRMHSKKLQHAFRYYSHNWRTWGACFIQAAWRRYKKRKMAKELAMHESSYYYNRNSGQEGEEEEGGIFEMSESETPLTGRASNAQNFGATILASKFAANTRRGVNQKVQATGPSTNASSTSLKMPKFLKPDEPDFSLYHEDDV
uniref:Cyclic nucleotide-binding domain-containing protein n=1 Tax=Cannabis sativa TaxID=3483 RepID=A0A803QLU1_CANSA